MKILLHTDTESENTSRIKNLIEDELPKIKIVQTNSQQHLSETLCRPLHNFFALIAVMDDSKGFSDLLSLKPLIENIKLILLVCKKHNDIIGIIIRLAPIYVKYDDNNFMDIISILKRIEQKQARAVNLFEILENSVL